MLRPRALLCGSLLLSLLSGCRHARPSKWEAAGAYTVCTCDGTERQPTPSEADGFRADERVDVMCEGRVRDCHPGYLEAPRSRRYNAPFDIHSLD